MVASDPSCRRRESSTSSSGSSFLFLSPIDQVTITGILDDIEEWCPLLERLRHNEFQFRKLWLFLDRKIDRLMTWGPIGTDEHQFDVLERLTKLKEGPLGATTTLDEAIEQRLEALTENHCGEQCSGRSGCQVGCLDPSLSFTYTISQRTLPLSAWYPQLKVQINNPDGSFENPDQPHFRIKRSNFILEEWDHDIMVWWRMLTKQNVTSIDHERAAEEVVVHVDNGDVWHLTFENTAETRAAVVYLMI